MRDGQTMDLPKGRFREGIVITASNVTVRGYDTVLFEASAEDKAAIITELLGRLGARPDETIDKDYVEL